jgi:prophage antirepressor-like protein
MDILKAFVLDGKEHNVTILWKDDKPLFRASEVAEIVGIRKVANSLISFDADEKVSHSTGTLGGTQDALFLTEMGVYRLLMRSTKPLAKPFQKWVCQVLSSIRQTGEYKLKVIDSTQDEIVRALKQEAQNTANQIEQSQHDTLVEAYKGRYVVYIGKIKVMDDGKILIKIGSTKNTIGRSQSLAAQYGSFCIFKIYECPCNEAFEKFLHKHDKIIKYRYNEPIYDNHVSNGEVFLVTPDDIVSILKIATHNKYKFSHQAEVETIIKMETIKLQQMQTRLEELKIRKDLETSTAKSESEDDIDDIIAFTTTRQHTQTRGNKIQRYCPEGKTLLSTYASYAFAIRDSIIPGATRSALKEAIKNCTLYKGFRWAQLSREDADDTIQTLAPTMDSVTVRIGFVAMLNLDKTEIVRVFCDQKSAAADRKFTSGASISQAIKRGTPSSGHCFMMWHDCDAVLKEKYLQSNNLPKKRGNVISQQVDQLHPITQTLISRYASIEDVIKKYKISRQTLKSAAQHGYILKGYKWKLVPKDGS